MEDYVKFKNWDMEFKPTDLEADLFEGEFRSFNLKGKKVLDIGFGNGGFMGWAKAKGAEVYGIDVISQAVELGRRKGFQTFLQFDFDQVAFKETFDCIAALDLFEHLNIDQIGAYLDLIESCLREGGFAILRFPNGQSPFGRIYQYADVTHITVMSSMILRQLLGDRRLRIITVRDPYFGLGFHKGVLYGCLKLVQKAARKTLFFILKKIVGLGEYNLDINTVVILQKPKMVD